MTAADVVDVAADVVPWREWAFPNSIQHDSEELLRLERRRQYAAGRADARGAKRLSFDEIRCVRFYAHVDDPRRAYWLGVLREAS